MTGTPCGCGANDWEPYYALGVLDGILFFVCGGCGRAKARAFFSPHLTDLSKQAEERWNWSHGIEDKDRADS